MVTKEFFVIITILIIFGCNMHQSMSKSTGTQDKKGIL